MGTYRVAFDDYYDYMELIAFVHRKMPLIKKFILCFDSDYSEQIVHPIIERIKQLESEVDIEIEHLNMKENLEIAGLSVGKVTIGNINRPVAT